MCHKCCKVACDRSVIKDTLLQSNVPSRLFLGFHWRDSPEKSYLAMYTHPLWNVQVWLRMANNKGYFIWRAMWLCCISASIGGIFLNIQSSKYPRIHYKQSKCRSHRLLIKRTLLRDDCAFSDTSRPSLEGLSWKFTPHTLHEYVTHTERLVSIDRRLMELDWHSTVLLGLHFSFRWRDFPET